MNHGKFQKFFRRLHEQSQLKVSAAILCRHLQGALTPRSRSAPPRQTEDVNQARGRVVAVEVQL